MTARKPLACDHTDGYGSTVVDDLCLLCNAWISVGTPLDVAWAAAQELVSDAVVWELRLGTYTNGGEVWAEAWNSQMPGTDGIRSSGPSPTRALLNLIDVLTPKPGQLPSSTELISLAEAATSLGVAQVTLRSGIKHGRLRAKKVGRNWATWPDAVEEYRAKSLGKPGRPSADRMSRVSGLEATPFRVPFSRGTGPLASKPEPRKRLSGYRTGR